MTETRPAKDPKAAMRARLRDRRQTEVASRDRAADGLALALEALRVAHDAGVRRGSWVAAYESMPLEPPTEVLLEALAARGIRVMVPVTLPEWDLDWREVGTDVTLGREAIGQAEVVFVPAHAVDADGHRIGQGKGCYDRALPRTQALVVAVVHPWELVDETLPHEPHDQLVHAVIAAGRGVCRVPAATTTAADLQ